jgi:prophage antirepressor-like protein
MSNQLTTFDFNALPVRVVEREGEPWFVAADVCKALGYNVKADGSVNTTQALKTLSPEEVTTTRISGNRGSLPKIISESGLYKLVMRSDKPEARAFQDWVTKVVLPAIRKDGAYVMGEEKVVTGEMSEDELVMKAMSIMQAKVERLKAERDGMAKTIGKFDHTINRVVRMLEGVNTNATKGDLKRLGYLYKLGPGAYRVYRKHNHLFTERFDEATGRGNIYCTPEGKALLARLYEEGKLTMKVGYQAA